MIQAINSEQVFVTNLEQFMAKADKFIKIYYSTEPFLRVIVFSSKFTVPSTSKNGSGASGRNCSPDSKAKGVTSVPSAKLQLFGEVLAELLENRHKALVFSQFVDHLHIIRDYLEEQSIKYQYNDIIAGNAQDNQLNDGEGKDIIVGGSGMDTLTGGRGKDTFVLGEAGNVFYLGEDFAEITDFKR